MKLLFAFSCLLFCQTAFSQLRTFPYKYNDKYGLVDENNNKVTEPVFDALQLFCNQKYNHHTRFGKKDETGIMFYGLVDVKGKITVPAIYKDLTYDGNGLYYFVRKLDTLQIMKLSDHTIVAKSNAWKLESYNSIVIYNDIHTNEKKVLFTDGTQKIIPPSYRPDYIVVNEDQACPVFICKNEIYDCTGKPTSNRNMVTETLEGTDYSIVEDYPGKPDQTPKTIDLSIADKLIGARQLTPIHDEEGNIEAITVRYQNSCALVNPQGEIIFSAEQCSFMDIWKNIFGDGVTYIEFGISGHTGLLTIKGKELLNDIFFEISMTNEWDHGHFNKNIEPTPQLFSVVHKSGYRGYADRSGKVFLPRECNCIK